MKSALAGFAIVIVLALGAWVLLRGDGAGVQASPTSGANVTMENGTQVVRIKVKGGYQPGMSEARTGIPTVLRFETNGTFDCTSTIRIPSLGITQSLPSSGTTDVAVGDLKPGTLQGTCGMGMYRFSVQSKS